MFFRTAHLQLISYNKKLHFSTSKMIYLPSNGIICLIAYKINRVCHRKTNLHEKVENKNFTLLKKKILKRLNVGTCSDKNVAIHVFCKLVQKILKYIDKFFLMIFFRKAM